MILTINQSAYLPWLGYFDKIIRSDLFVLLDSVQYGKNSFINRNRIKTMNGPIWLTVPVRLKGHTSQILKDTEIDNRRNWQAKHLKSIFYNYRKANRFGQLYPKLEILYKNKYSLLSDLCYDHLKFWLNELNIRTKTVCSSDLSLKSKKSDLMLEICKHFGANCYLSGPFGKDYLNEKEFQKAGIDIEYQSYQHPVYPQLYGDFIPNMGVVDFCMNTTQLSIKIT